MTNFSVSKPKSKNGVRSVLSRTIMIFAVLVLVSACSSKDDEELVLDGQGGMGMDQSMGQPMDDGMYQGDTGAPAPGTQADLVVNVGDRVFFETDSSDLNSEARRILDAQAAWLQRYPNLSVVVEGHADERGTREYNLALSERRANSARTYLSAMGVPSNRLETIAYGKERPAVPGADASAWSQNRRAATRVE